MMNETIHQGKIQENTRMCSVDVDSLTLDWLKLHYTR